MTTSTASRHQIPTPCCAPGHITTNPDGTLWLDHNKDATCKRAAVIYMLTRWAESIDSERARADCLPARRAANLRAWADEQETRLVKLANRFAAGELEHAVCAGVGHAPGCDDGCGLW